jgi:hypothetical protein
MFRANPAEQRCHGREGPTPNLEQGGNLYLSYVRHPFLQAFFFVMYPPGSPENLGFSRSTWAITRLVYCFCPICTA